jgi:hypothetical protein
MKANREGGVKAQVRATPGRVQRTLKMIMLAVDGCRVGSGWLVERV